MIPKEQKSITTLKWSTGQLFTAATQNLTPAVVKYNNLERKWSVGSINDKDMVFEEKKKSICKDRHTHHSDRDHCPHLEYVVDIETEYITAS
jgi:hypothetical protein